MSTETERLPPMTHYVVGLFRPVPGRPILPDDEAARIQEGHLAHLRRLRESGESITSGPLEPDTEIRGIVIFCTSTIERARELAADDPAIVSGRLLLDLYTWFAPVGLRIRADEPSPTDLDFQSD